MTRPHRYILEVDLVVAYLGIRRAQIFFKPNPPSCHSCLQGYTPNVSYSHGLPFSKGIWLSRVRQFLMCMRLKFQSLLSLNFMYYTTGVHRNITSPRTFLALRFFDQLALPVSSFRTSRQAQLILSLSTALYGFDRIYIFLHLEWVD